MRILFAVCLAGGLLIAAPATAQDRKALSTAIPTGYLKKRETTFRDLDLTLYEPASR